MVTHTWHTSKYKVHKLHQRYMIRLEKRMFTSLCVCVLTVAVPRAQQDGCHVPELLAQHDGRQVWGVHRWTFPQAGRAQDVGMHGVSLDFVPAREPRQAEPREWGDSSGASFQCCFPSTETIRLIRDEATSTFTAQDGHLHFHAAPEPECCFTSTETVRCIAWVLLYVHRDRTVYCLSVALRPQRPYGVLRMGDPGSHLHFHTAPGLCSGVFFSSAVIIFASLALRVCWCGHRKLRVGAVKRSMLRGIAGSRLCPSPCPCTGTACALSLPSLAEARAGEARW